MIGAILLEILALLLLIGLIVVACEAFTNGIEWLGSLLGLHEGAVGSVLAAVGTALPETLVPIVAIVGAGALSLASAPSAIGVGAIVGAPFMLATLAMFVSGVAVVLFTRRGWREEALDLEPKDVRLDLTVFLLAYAAAIGISFLPPWRIAGAVTVRQALGFVFLAAYAWYTYRTITGPGEPGEDLDPLYFARRHARPPLWRVLVQVLVALAGIVAATHFFVDALEHLARNAGVSPLVLSLFITPIATELPEKYNSVTWLRVNKDRLAIGNITGAMVFQSTVLVAVGLWLTPWKLSWPALVSSGLAVASGGLLWWRAGRRLSAFSLLAGGGFYLAFVVALLAWH